MSRRRIAIRHPGSLSKYGFDLSEPEKEQMTAIRKADRKYGKGETNRKLAALEAFNKHRPQKRKRIRSLIRKNGGA
ncbi:MAG: hypothetical protein KIY10_09290 [Thermoplasmata archaeon]|jgi:hypothetical protein|nr:hypothetical protein [Candidatus Sysuiplasma jiujiangense]